MDRDSPLLRFLLKEWPKEFSQPRKPVDQRPYLETLRAAVQASGGQPDGDDIALFMGADFDDSTSLNVRSAIQYLQTIRDDKLHDQAGTGKKGTAWLDDRTYVHARPPESSCSRPDIASHERDITDTDIIPVQRLLATDQESRGLERVIRRSRLYHAPLNASELHAHLREKQFDHEIHYDADRHLIYIADPDAYDFSALITTVGVHQERALRDAICQHLASDTTIKATIGQAYLDFRLEFQIPFFAMRRSRLEQGFAPKRHRSHRGWMNISFLDTKDTDADIDSVCGVHQAHISVTIGGTDNTRWFVYCFEDRHFEEDRQLEKDEETGEHQPDQVAAGAFGAENPIWNPREYFLRVFLIRMCQVQKEWEALVCFIETGIKEYSWGRSLSATARDGMPQDVGDATVATRLDYASQLLSTLLEELARTNAAWTRFISATGDLAYFMDTTPNPRMVRTFCGLHEVFDKLCDFETRLQRIAEQSEKRAHAINLRIAAENKRSVDLAIYYISPFAIVSTFFAIPVPIIAFDRNLLSFCITMLLYVLILKALLFLFGGTLRRSQWWKKLSRRARASVRGGQGITIQQGGVTVLRRRSTWVSD